MRTSIFSLILAGMSLVLGASEAHAVVLSSDLPSPQPAASTITFTIEGTGDANERYRLSVGPSSDPSQVGVVYDYHQDNVLEWTPIDPGDYLVIGTVLDTETGQQSYASQAMTILPLVPEATTSPVALPTSNPLVALYAAPPCVQPGRMRVLFVPQAGGIVQTTSTKPCDPNTPLHFYVAGMRESTTYLLHYQISAPNGTLLGESLSTEFTTGVAEIQISPSIQTIPYGAQASFRESVIWVSPLFGNQALGLSPYIHATDTDGHLIWYLNELAFALRPGDEGTFWLLKPDPNTEIQDNVLFKVDLLGNVVKQTNVPYLNYQLEQLGYSDRVNDIHHDVRELSNGDIAFISTVERLVTDVQGPGEVSVLGDMIIVTNKDFEIRWVWNGWDHLDPTRLATLGEVCTVGGIGCPPFYLADQTNDWMHTNALAYTPDGNLLLSVRHQDWIVKINYANGAGDGSVLWRLGREGDVALVGGNEDDWFSHTHDPSFISHNRIIVFDNSNFRCTFAEPEAGCQSRGQVWEIDESTMTAQLVVNKDLGEYSFALGSAQQLLNNNYWFNSGFLGDLADPRATVQELDPSANAIFQIDLNMFQYRSYRLVNLYKVPSSWDWTQRWHRGGWSGGSPKRPGRLRPGRN